MKYGPFPNLKLLQQAWYRRLKEEGFQDAEELIGGELVLKQIAAHPYRGMDHLAIATKEAYYRLLGLQIAQGGFANDVDKTILTLFANGEKIRVICEKLRVLGKTRSRGGVRFIIRKYEMKWGLREYTAKQLNRKEAS